MVRVILIAALSALIAGLWVVDREGGPDWLEPYTPGWLGPDEGLADAADGANGAGQAGAGAEPDAGEPAPAVSSSPSSSSLSSSTRGGIAANEGMRINEAGLNIIKESEGLRLEAYSAGGRTYIGYGHQRKPGDPMRITEAEADAFLREDVMIAEKIVRDLLTRSANENEFSAMVSLAYNLGGGNFRRSDVPKKFNDGDTRGAADAFRNHNKAGGVVIPHLTDRREKERALFLTPA